jgi:hypothetical protein
MSKKLCNVRVRMLKMPHVLRSSGALAGQALSGERAYERQVAEARAKGLPIPPRTTGMEVYSGAPVEGRQPVREIGFT